jgi:glycosyltransferase involved in cell wall biosynthesis
VVLEDSLKRQFARFVPTDRIHVVPNGVHDHARSSQRPPVVPTVLHLSTLWSYKGVFDVISAAELVVEVRPDARFILAGAWYSEAERLDAIRRVGDSGLSHSVTFPGPVVGTDKTSLLNEATVFVLPSRGEGQPLVLLEALSAGLPVVTTPVGAISETISDGYEGFVVDVGDVDALASRICLLLGDAPLQRRMGRRARETWEARFTPERFVQKLDAVWRSVLRVAAPLDSRDAHRPDDMVAR